MRLYPSYRSLCALLGGSAMALCAAGGAAQAPADGPPRTNAFNDPFVQVTHAIAECPVPEGPLYTCLLYTSPSPRD